MTRDGAQENGQPGAEASVPARDERLRRRGIDVCEVEPPREQRRERAARLGGDRQRAVLTEHGDADRSSVESLRVRADDVPLDAAVPPLVDGAETVDEEVVTDVVPAVALHVVELDRLDYRRRLGGRVAVRARRVVDDRHTQRRGERRSGAPDLLVRIPAAARDDRRCFRPLQPARGHARVRARHEPGAETDHAAARPVLDPVGRANPPRVAQPPAVLPSALDGAGIGSVLGLRRRVHPLAPAARDRARPKLHRPRTAPMDSDEIEPGRRHCRRQRALAGERNVARDDRRLLRESRRRQGEHESDEGQQASGHGRFSTGGWRVHLSATRPAPLV